MESKESKHSKAFPKRILSSFRKGKKIHLHASRNGSKTSSGTATGFTSLVLENAQNENAAIDLEATIVLDTPSKKQITNTFNLDQSVTVTPKRNLRNVFDEESTTLSSNVSTPRAPRLVLGGPMSASTDSGIDCSILMSEKSSPEQFVSFTRREAERIRQEQLNNLSVLETLEEIDRSSSEDSKTSFEINTYSEETMDQDDCEGAGTSEQEHHQASGAGGSETLSECVDDEITDVLEPDQSDTVSAAEDQSSQSNGSQSNTPATDSSIPSGNTVSHSLTEQQTRRSPLSFGSDNNTNNGDYVLLTDNTSLPDSPLVDVTAVIGRNNQTTRHSSRNADFNYQANLARLENGPVISWQVTNNSDVRNISLLSESDSDIFHNYANRTDETKSAEAQFQQTDNSLGSFLNRSVSHDIVSPIPVVSTSVAAHRVLPSTPSPARLYVNENSAFAKCKSLKRSVSDVGKEILGRLILKGKDSAISKEGVHVPSLDTKSKSSKKSGFSKGLRKFGKRDKGNSRVRHNSEQLSKSSQETKLLLSQSYDLSNEPSVTKSQTRKSRVSKDIENAKNVLYRNPKLDNHVSPVYKEILSGSVKNELEVSFQRRKSPNVPESIEDITNGISEMTSALIASSAESIACICDCKNRFSNPECCDKRKSPSPLGRDTSIKSCDSPVDNANEKYNDIQTFEIYPKDDETREFDNLLGVCEMSPCLLAEKKPTRTKEMVEKLDFSDKNCYFCSDNDDDSSDESSDEHHHHRIKNDDDSTCDDSDDDLDCSNCCNASPNTGNYELTSSSDSECSISDSCENLSIQKNRTGYFNDTTRESLPRSRSDTSSRSSSSASSSKSSSSSCTPEKSSQSGKDESFNVEISPYSVSFCEIDFENGDVMYVENCLDEDPYSEDLDQTSVKDKAFNKKLSSLCATPVSSPMVNGNRLDDTRNLHKKALNNSSIRDKNKVQVSDCPEQNWSHPCTPLLSPLTNNTTPQEYSPGSVDVSPTPLNLSLDSTFTNVSFEGSFADVNLSVCSQADGQYSEPNGQNDELLGANGSINGEQVSDHKLENSSGPNSVGNGNDFSIDWSSSRDYDIQRDMNDSYLDLYAVAGYGRQAQFRDLNDSRMLPQYRQSYHAEIHDSSQLNDSSKLTVTNSCSNDLYVSRSTDTRRHDISLSEKNRHLQRGTSDRHLNRKYGTSLNRSNTSVLSPNQSFNRFNRSYSSFHGCSPASSPLDLSMNKSKTSAVKNDRKALPTSNSKWIDRHVGQVYSPAKRVLHKNRGLSESDLCKQILDLYVSDADESGFEQIDGNDSLNNSSLYNTSMDKSNLSSKANDRRSASFVESGSEDEQPGLQYGTYVAPRNVVKETNVDDFTTTTKWTCYTGEARTRKLQGQLDGSVLKDESRSADPDDQCDLPQNSQLGNKSKIAQRRNGRAVKTATSKGQVLKDSTNTSLRLSSLQVPTGFEEDINPEGIKEEIENESHKIINLTDKSFDRLTMLHTAHNSQRKVRCLTMDESQNVVKCYPPPKEASKISWGQTLSEMDLYRHTPRKTPVKTRPILNQKENNYPYDEADTPSPIVLTRMRKPKSLAKRYKNWPWS